MSGTPKSESVARLIELATSRLMDYEKLSAGERRSAVEEVRRALDMTESSPTIAVATPKVIEPPAWTKRKEEIEKRGNEETSRTEGECYHRGHREALRRRGKKGI